jgi:MFS family permease
LATVAEQAAEAREHTDVITVTELETTDLRSSSRGGALSALESRSFLLFWLSLALSLTGVWVRITAQGWLVYDLTNDRFLLGVVSFCQAAPVLIFSPIAGAIIDRVDRRKVLIVVQLTVASAMFVLATLTVADRIQVWEIMIIAAIAGSASAFDWPARMSMVPALVSRDKLQSAVALNSAAFNASRILGPIIGGALIGLVGAGICFYVNAFTYLPFIFVLVGLGVDQTLPRGPKSQRGARSDLMDGYRYIWRTPRIRGLLSIDIVPLAFGITYLTLAPALAKDVLHVGSGGLGVLQAANGIGALLGTIAVATLSGIHHRGKIVITGVGLFGFLVILFGLSRNFYISVAIILCIGLVIATYGTLNDTLVQTLVDDGFRGRVLAVYSMFWGLTPIGSLEAGIIAQKFGIGAALVLNGFLVVLYVPVLLFRTPVRIID